MVLGGFRSLSRSLEFIVGFKRMGSYQDFRRFRFKRMGSYQDLESLRF